jgi:hypothetical protein
LRVKLTVLGWDDGWVRGERHNLLLDFPHKVLPQNPEDQEFGNESAHPGFLERKWAHLNCSKK